MPLDDLDKWVEEIQKEINEEAVKRYNEYIVELLQNPKKQLPKSKNGIEIGVGSGRFAALN
ncbi:unnamed protein product [marine sediment metagenome]|uniref:Uncharacterized protein n=1 Tax=marine sediment metagenome TaxID=412755 RepID=X1GUG5_9ZZZZ